MADAFEIIMQEHRDVEQLFERFMATEDDVVAMTICRELTMHTTLEEELIYPILRDVDADLAAEAEKEHRQARQLIDRVELMSGGNGYLRSAVQELRQAVDHHVEEEEREVLPKLRRAVAGEMAWLGQQWVERKSQLEPTGVIDLREKSKDELYERAKQLDVRGRSDMNKEQLVRALQRR
jgi:hemerythrin superfamily protein